jgi:hypothetical protein
MKKMNKINKMNKMNKINKMNWSMRFMKKRDFSLISRK